MVAVLKPVSPSIATTSTASRQAFWLDFTAAGLGATSLAVVGCLMDRRSDCQTQL